MSNARKTLLMPLNVCTYELLKCCSLSLLHSKLYRRQNMRLRFAQTFSSTNFSALRLQRQFYFLIMELPNERLRVHPVKRRKH